MYGVATTQMYMFRQCNLSAKWIRSTAVAISWRLVRLNHIGELSENFFNLPCTRPISNLAYEAFLLAFVLDTVFQSSVPPAKHHILTSELHGGTEIIRTIPDVNDAIIVRIAFEERFEFLTFAYIWVAATWTVMLWPVGIDVPSDSEQTRWVPLSGVGHYLREKVLEPF